MSAGEEVGFSNFLIDRSSDLSSHFDCCDYLITSYSTVGMEFIPYYKPLLVLDYLKEDQNGYISENVGIPIYDRSNLFETLSNNSLQVDRQMYNEYLKKFYKTGQNVVDDICEEIEKGNE